MTKRQRFFAYKGITLDRDGCWYTLIPIKIIEKGYGDNDFDIRRLPRKYRHGETLELDLSGAKAAPSAGYLYEPEAVKHLMKLNDEVHKEVLRHAIDDGYDFSAAARGNYGQFLRRSIRWMNNISRAKPNE